jgi:GT2 family glycosyltransferase
MRFSVVIPTHDRIELLAGCLNALGEVDYPRSEFEAIVVDDASARPAGPGALPAPAGVAIRFLRLDENGGPAAARNLGARHAAGEYLVFTDDDCRARPDLLRQLDRILNERPDVLVGCRLEFVSRPDLAAAATQAIMDTVYGYFNPDPGDAHIFAGPCLAIRASRFHAVGGFDESYRTYEDYDFCVRCRIEGVRLVYASEAKVVHQSSPSLRRFWRRHYLYGRGAYRFHTAEAARAGTSLRLRPDST